MGWLHRLMRIHEKEFSRDAYARAGPEDRASIDFWNQVRQAALEGRLNAVVVHCANEGRRTQTYSAKLLAMGLVPGTADYLVLTRQWSGVIEMKADQNKLTPAQIDFAAWCMANGVHHKLCRSAADAIDTLQSWGAMAPRRGLPQ